MRRRPGVHHVLLLALLAGVAWWVGQRAQAVRQDPAAVLEALRAAHGPYLPTPERVGATHREPVENFNPATLYDFINGAADAYLARGFTRCIATAYVFSSEAGDTFEVSAEVYRFATVQGAREQLEAELPVAARPVPGAAEAWWDAGVLLAVAGTDYLKLTAFGRGGPAVEGALGRLLAAWQRGEQE